jgi:hypothetical protein
MSLAIALTWAVSERADAAIERSVAHNSKLCDQRPGRTVFRHGGARVFVSPHPHDVSGEADGCLRGSTSEIELWQTGPEERGLVRQLAGHFIAAEWEFGNQYGYSEWVAVFDLRTRAAYYVATSSGPVDGPSVGTPNAFSRPLNRFVLSPTGRTARLYDTYPADASETNPIPDGEVLDVVGFHHFKRTLASAAPGAIEPASLQFAGPTVRWTENGVRHSATA